MHCERKGQQWTWTGNFLDHTVMLFYCTQVGESTVAFRPEADRYRLTPRHTAYLRVAEGCNHSCTFCAIPGFRYASFLRLSLYKWFLSHRCSQGLSGRQGSEVTRKKAESDMSKYLHMRRWSAKGTSADLKAGRLSMPSVIVRQAEDIVAGHNDHG